ncbi:MAG: hypothetical protein LQ340_007926, partial [Diploschistes diacapsis]
MAAALVSSSALSAELPQMHPNAMEMAPTSDELITTTLSASAHTFLKAPSTLHTAALVLAKRYLDPLATSVSEVQHVKLQAARRKRKRGDDGGPNSDSVLRLKQVHMEGLSLEQVWEQARRVLDASCKEVESSLPAENGRNLVLRAAPAVTSGTHRPVKTVRFADAASETDSQAEIDRPNDSDAESEDPAEEKLVEEGLENDDLVNGEEESSGSVVDSIGEEELDDIEAMDEDGEDFAESNSANSSTFVKDKNGLNDGFFSIDDFNRDTDFLEQQDARGDPDDGAASDEEDVDWDTDPLAQRITSVPGTSKRAQARAFSPQSSEEDGPTFGNADLNAPWSSGSEAEDDEDLPMDDSTNNANEIYYGDFFAPPAKAKSKTSRRHTPSKAQPTTSAAPDALPTEEDLNRTISAVHRDIFSDDSLSNPSDASDLDPSDPTAPTSNGTRTLSSHERRQLALAQQIRQLEASAVAKRQWTLSGEARAADRPLNSLLEEDLDFERAGKPVPLVTAATTSSLEELIKTRILARQFDEVPRRRPGAGDDLLAGTANRRRGLVEISDARDERGLAEIYAEEHVRETDPHYVDRRDARLRAAHEEVERLWREVSGKLDALSSWHYRPKPADLRVTVVSDAPR